MFRKTIKEYEIGVLWMKGQILGTIAPGRYWMRWGQRVDIYDTRPKLLPVPAQEVQTADKVAVKVTLRIEFAQTDPIVSLRTAELTTEALMDGQRDLEKRLQERVAAKFAELGYELKALVVRDVILPRRLRDAYAAELAARTEGKARLELARAQTAALRHLANAAETAERHPQLLQLLALQAADKAAEPQVSIQLKS
jgi:regulator of protease activity HflC (stomatin/prohibitin superfamily)